MGGSRGLQVREGTGSSQDPSETDRDWKVREELVQGAWPAFESDEVDPFTET